MPPIRAAQVLLAFTATACVPVATHGPRVEPGMMVGSVVALGTRPTLEGEVRTGQSNVTPVAPPMGAFARYGWTGEGVESAIPVSAGVFVPIALPFSITHPELDVYVQATPPQWRTAGGGGVLVSRSYVTPYVQLGGDGEEASIYTTQSVAFFGGSGPSATVWMPSVALKVGGAHFFAQAGLGRETVRQESGVETTRAVRFLMGGVIAEASLGRARRRF